MLSLITVSLAFESECHLLATLVLASNAYLMLFYLPHATAAVITVMQ